MGIFDSSYSYVLYVAFTFTFLCFLGAASNLFRYRSYLAAQGDKAKAVRYLLRASSWGAIGFAVLAIGLNIFFKLESEVSVSQSTTYLVYRPFLTFFGALGVVVVIFALFAYLKRFNREKFLLFQKLLYVVMIFMAFMIFFWGIFGLGDFLESFYLSPKWLFYLVFYLSLLMFLVIVFSRYKGSNSKV